MYLILRIVSEIDCPLLKAINYCKHLSFSSSVSTLCRCKLFALKCTRMVVLCVTRVLVDRTPSTSTATREPAAQRPTWVMYCSSRLMTRGGR